MDINFFESKPASEKSRSLRRPIYGVGINDADFVTQVSINGKKFMHPAYDCWRQIIRRCYSEKSLEKKPRYLDASVCAEWLYFSNFLLWWKRNHVPSWQIDKDILTDSKIYSPFSCIFVPKWINCIVNDSLRSRGKLLIGASNHSRDGVIEAYARNSITNKQEYLGRFHNQNDAHCAWKVRRLEIIDQLKCEMDLIDSRIYKRVKFIISERLV
jgi:hypothetical protein